MIELGLQRISRLLAQTRLPWRAIHVAGTNGKGSICAYVSSMIDAYNTSAWRLKSKQAPLKHARFTSPHLVDRWDCITINQQTVSFELFDRIERKVLARDKLLGTQASEFEILTATAFEIFALEQIDVAVVEVGMGGKLDATNVIGELQQDDEAKVGPGPDPDHFRPRPLVCAISKIGLDHQSFLGDTLVEIANQKAGIIKPFSNVVYDNSNEDAVCRVFERTAAHHKAAIVRDVPFRINGGGHLQAGIASEGQARPWPEHTSENFRVALLSLWCALVELGRMPVNFHGLDAEHRADIDAVIAKWRELPLTSAFPGRLQRIGIERLTGRRHNIILDGAHNAQSAHVLCDEVETALKYEEWTQPSTQAVRGPVTWVVAISSTKDCREMLHILLRPGDRVHAVEFGPVDGMPWVQPMSSKQIALVAKSMNVRAKAYGRDLMGALQGASLEAGEGILVVAGSLYLVSDILRLLRDGK